MITLVSNPHHPTTPALRYGTQYMKKFRLSEKHTKFEKNGFDKSADLLSKRQKHEEAIFKFFELLKKSEL